MGDNFRESDNFMYIEKMKRDQEFSMSDKHIHSYYEIYYLLSGDRYYFIEDRTLLIKKGTIVFINSNQIHRTSDVNKASHERILIKLNKSSFNKEQFKLGEFFIPNFFSLYYGAITFREEDQHNIELLLESMLLENTDKKIGYQTILLTKLTELLIYSMRVIMLKSDTQIPNWAESAKHKKVHEVAEYIKNYYASPNSLDGLAKQFYVSKYYLSRIFKEVTGFTVIEYINITRVRHAKDLLDNSNKSITEIANVLGFDSIGYFERVFKSFTDISPLKYRKGN